MIPLRRQLIVKEHGNLLYPEGTACADVLIAGDKGGSFASRVFYGLGTRRRLTRSSRTEAFRGRGRRPRDHNPSMAARRFAARGTTSEYLGVGYIIGPKIAGVIFAGGVFSWLVMMPAIKFFGGLADADLSEHDAHRPDDVRPALEVLHPPHRRGGGGGGRPHHAAQDARPPSSPPCAPAPTTCARARERRSRRVAHSQDLPMTVVLGGLAGDRGHDVGVADLQARARRAHRLGRQRGRRHASSSSSDSCS